MNVKTLFMSMAILFISFSSGMAINKNEVPKAVLDAFSKKYPTAKKVEWESQKSGEEEYEVQFKLDGVKKTSKFSAEGSWLETESVIKTADLPKSIKTAITTQFEGYEMEEVELLETPELAKAYEVVLKNEENDTEVKAVFSPDGKLLDQKVNSGEEEEEEEGNN